MFVYFFSSSSPFFSSVFSFFLDFPRVWVQSTCCFPAVDMNNDEHERFRWFQADFESDCCLLERTREPLNMRFSPEAIACVSVRKVLQKPSNALQNIAREDVPAKHCESNSAQNHIKQPSLHMTDQSSN